VLTLGEVHTGLLQNSSAVSPPLSAHLTALVLGERVRCFERPIAYAVSPDVLTGVDSRLATSSGAKARGIGTVVSRAAITGGHVLQSSAVVRMTKSGTDRRLPWSHYLSKPGTVETVGRVDWADLARGFVAPQPSAGCLDLGAICGRVMDTVQASAELDRLPPFRMARTRLRWVMTPTELGPAGRMAGNPQAGSVQFAVEHRTLRTVWLSVDKSDTSVLIALCEDLALHDWLLTTLLELVERSRIGATSPAQVVSRLRPAVDHLLHLWVPAARLDESVAHFWDNLERRPGFSRQWHASVNRIRDQIAISTIALLLEARAGEHVRPV
jgi:hypothetical protein